MSAKQPKPKDRHGRIFNNLFKNAQQNNASANSQGYNTNGRKEAKVGVLKMR